MDLANSQTQQLQSYWQQQSDPATQGSLAQQPMVPWAAPTGGNQSVETGGAPSWPGGSPWAEAGLSGRPDTRQEAAWYPTQPGLAYFDTQAQDESDSSATSSDSGTEQLPELAVQGMTPAEAELHGRINELHERIAEASLPQEARFLRHLATMSPTTSYTAEGLWSSFVGWRENFEPGANYIKSQTDLTVKLGVLWAQTPGCTKGEMRLAPVTDAAGNKKTPKARTWYFDQAVLCRHFGISIDGETWTDAVEPPSPIHDLEAEADEFVKHLLPTPI